jgi:hypothetical protein
LAQVVQPQLLILEPLETVVLVLFLALLLLWAVVVAEVRQATPLLLALVAVQAAARVEMV